MDVGSSRAREDTLACSFCGKSQKAVGKLISSPSTRRAYICDECIEVCNAIIADDQAESANSSPPEESPLLTHPAVPDLLAALEVWLRKDALDREAVSALAEVRRIGAQILATTGQQ